MIGFYDYTVILTYLSILSGTAGIILCLNGIGHPYLGMFFLLFSGLCDTFDGKVARMKKDRTAEMKRFGNPDRFPRGSDCVRRASGVYRYGDVPKPHADAGVFRTKDCVAAGLSDHLSERADDNCNSLCAGGDDPACLFQCDGGIGSES